MGTLAIIPPEVVESKILFFRGKKVMLDKDLAILYGVETRALNQAVKRNLKRFPPDFMFQLTKEEMKNWTSQIVISNKEKMGLRKMPFAFTENGVAMLSSVLNSERAITVNIQIMRTFTRLREMLITHKELARNLTQLERKIEKHDGEIKLIFDAIRQLMIPSETKKKKIGFKREKEV
ncbi:MAG: ORF6N domain-containing protein [Nitrospiraceae bacterium]|nr:MAG: ORF6N domain-containing protein [Nitrospiraceae bacterium]